MNIVNVDKIFKARKLVYDLCENKVFPKLNIEEYAYDVIWFQDSELFYELADPDWAYEYKRDSKYEWSFKDIYGNRLGISIDTNRNYINTYFIIKDKNGVDQIIYDYNKNKHLLDPTDFQGGTDEHRSDTWAKILRDEIIPEFLLNKNENIIKIHPIDEYRHKIFLKASEICKQKYPQIEIKQSGKEIWLINK